LVNGVLIERTIKEILPAVSKNLDGISGVIAKLSETLQKRQEELIAFQSKYNLSQHDTPKEEKKDGDKSDKSAKSERSSGVLVE